MSLFQLDPASLAARARAQRPPHVPSLGASLLIGTVGFMLVSVAGFVPWAVFGHELHGRFGERGLYGICAAVFVALSGVALHRLIIGRGSLVRFYGVFTLAFAAYASLWIKLWMTLRGHPGSVAGLLGGTIAMGTILALVFGALRRVVPVIVTLFLLNAAGYFIGGFCEAALFSINGLAARLSWGVCYGLGFGAGLGLAFYLCQAEARRLLAAPE